MDDSLFKNYGYGKLYYVEDPNYWMCHITKLIYLITRPQSEDKYGTVKKYLEEHPKEVNKVSHAKWTVLMILCATTTEKNHFELIQLLLLMKCHYHCRNLDVDTFY